MTEHEYTRNSSRREALCMFCGKGRMSHPVPTISRVELGDGRGLLDRVWVNVGPTTVRTYDRWQDGRWVSEYIIEYGSGRFTDKLVAGPRLEAILDAAIDSIR